MMSDETKFGAAGIEYPTVPLLLEKKVKKNNILIGNDPTQIRFAEQYLSVEFEMPIHHEAVPFVNDTMLLGKDEPRLYLIDVSQQMDISPKIKEKTGIWSLDMIERGSAGLNAIIRYAAKLLDKEKPSKAVMDRVAKELVNESDPTHRKNLLADIRASVWQAAWYLTAPETGPLGWLAPWENWLMWLPRGGDPNFRLNALYRELVMWVFAQNADDRGFKRTGGSWDVKRWQKLSKLRLPQDKVYQTLTELSKWRTHFYDPYVCVIRISKIWETS